MIPLINCINSINQNIPFYQLNHKRLFPDTPLSNVEFEGYLDRKHLCLPGQKRAPNRAWRNYYTVLCGQVLGFFKNKEDVSYLKASCSPVNVHNALCTIADDYLKRRYTFRLVITDGSEFLFACGSELEMTDWINRINFRAKLPPSQQLIHFEIAKVR